MRLDDWDAVYSSNCRVTYLAAADEPVSDGRPGWRWGGGAQEGIAADGAAVQHTHAP